MNETAFSRFNNVSSGKDKVADKVNNNINRRTFNMIEKKSTQLGLINSKVIMQKRPNKSEPKGKCAPFNHKNTGDGRRPVRIIRWLKRPTGPITVPASMSVDSTSSSTAPVATTTTKDDKPKKKKKLILTREMLTEIDEDSVLACLDKIATQGAVAEETTTLEFPLEIEIYESLNAEEETRGDNTYGDGGISGGGGSFSSISVVTHKFDEDSNDSFGSFPAAGFRALDSSMDASFADHASNMATSRYYSSGRGGGSTRRKNTDGAPPICNDLSEDFLADMRDLET